MLTMGIFDQYLLTAEMIKSFVEDTFEGLIKVVIISDQVAQFQFRVLTEKPDIILVDSDFVHDDMVCLLEETLEGYPAGARLPMISIMHTTESAKTRECILTVMELTDNKVCFIKKPLSHTEFANCIIEDLLQSKKLSEKELKHTR